MSDEDPVRANFQDEDRVHFLWIMLFKYFLIFSKLGLLLMTISFFGGVIWQFIAVELYEFTKKENKSLNPNIYNTDTFV